MIELRWYQEEAIQSLFDYFMSNPTGNPVVAMPTGTGKSVVIAGFFIRALHYYPKTRAIMAVHVKKLISQNADKLIKMWPSAPVGIHSAGLKQRDTWQPLIYGGIASLVKYISELGYRDILFIDEAHLVSPDEATLYQILIEGLKVKNPNLKVIGTTATPFRIGQGMITDGQIFNDICYDLTRVDQFNRLISEGYISPLVSFATKTQIDVSNVKIQGGEFNQKQLQKAADKTEITYAAVQEIINKAGERNCWLVFSEGIEHADNIADMFTSFGIAAASVHSKKKSLENDTIIKAFETGRLTCLVNADILTTGFDHPPIDLIACIRHTMSPALWVQMLGRGTRPYDPNNPGQYIPGFNKPKVDCLVLDFAQNLMRLGPINEPRIPKAKGDDTGDAPIKICEDEKVIGGVGCEAYNYAAARLCWFCGCEFRFEPKIEKFSAVGQFVKNDDIPVVETFVVNRVYYNKHEKPGSLPTMRVRYYCNGGAFTFNEFVPFEHSGPARRKAEQWWQQRHAWEPPPTVDLALTQMEFLKVPARIRVWLNKKPFAEILGHEY